MLSGVKLFKKPTGHFLYAQKVPKDAGRNRMVSGNHRSAANAETILHFVPLVKSKSAKNLPFLGGFSHISGLFRVNQSDQRVERAVREDPLQKYEELIVQPDRIDRLMARLLRDARDEATRGRRIHARLLVVLHPGHGRLMRPPYTSSPSMVFSRAAVKPVWMSPGWTAQTVMPKGRSSFASAIV